MRDEIQQGTFPPGSRLRQSVLARRFGVSTTPVREALAALQAEGIVQIDPHRGALVFEPTVDDLRERFEIRKALEVLAVRNATTRITPHQIEELQRLVQRMRREQDGVAWMSLNDEFHLKLYGAADMPRLLELIEGLRKTSRYYINIFVTYHLRSHRADDEHQAILDACRDHDVEQADAAMRAHLDQTLKGVIGYLDGSIQGVGLKEPGRASTGA